MKKLPFFSALILSATLAACGGGDPESASDKPKSLLPDDFVPPVSSSSSSSSASTIVNESIPFHENFDSAINTRSFFSADYKALNTDTDLAFYFSTGGFLDELGNPSPTATSWITADDNRKLQIGNGRLTFGQTRQEINSTTADTSIPTWGEFNLSKPYKISFCVVEVSGPSGSNFELYVDNNTTGGNNSRYGAGNASRILQVATHTLVPGERKEVTVPATEGGTLIGTETSFFQFRVSSGGWAVIDDVVVEYVGEPHGLTVPACVAETTTPPAPEAPPATPSTPTLLAGDGQITVSWTSVGVQTTYDVLYNTIDSLDGAIPFDGNPVSGTTATITGLINDTPYYVFIRATNAIGSSEYSASASTTPKVPAPATGTPLPYSVNLAVSKDAFFGLNGVAPAQTLKAHPELPMNFIEGGSSGITLDEASGTVTIASGGRFTIGQISVPEPVDTSDSAVVAGDLDLRQPYTIIIQVVSASDTGKFQVYVDNNTTSQDKSIHGGASRIYDMSAASIGDNSEIRLEVGGPDIPFVGTANSFIQLRTDSAIGAEGIVISGIRIEPSASGAEAWEANALHMFGTEGPDVTGNVSLNEDDAITFTASGGDLGGSHFRAFYAHRPEPVAVPFTFTARLVSIGKTGGGTFSSTGNSRRYGLMVMEDIQPVSAGGSYQDVPRFSGIELYASTNAPTFQGSRTEKRDIGAGSSRGRGDAAGVAVGGYLRISVDFIEIDGVQTLRARRYFSADGITYTLFSSNSNFINANGNPFPTSMYVGFHAAPREDELTFVYDNITITPDAVPSE